jgi:predicted phosphoadenosine phosphosulfate sulfurtransferase
MKHKKGPYLMIKHYDKNTNVYEAALKRIEFIFDNFARVYLSFSGGKDSGVMLNLTIDYMRKNKIKTKLGVMIMDNETNYQESLDFMHHILQKNLDILDVYWLCLPLSLPCSVSSYRSEWQCWLKEEESQWVRAMPNNDYVVNEDNHPFDFFRPRMLDKEFYDSFGEWYSKGKSCASMIGIRADESLNRLRAIMNKDKEIFKGKMWTKKNTDHTYNVYPIYDWKTSDIWTANAKFQWEYNKLYDLFYMAGVPIGSMRVASAFMSESKSSLNLYRVIDPQCWARLCSRVGGANFSATYGKQLNYNSFSLPKGHTWKSFVKFLIDTLPEETSKNFKERIVQSIKYWGRVGRGLSDEVIQSLKANSVKFYYNGTTPHGGNSLQRIRIRHPPDNMDFLKTEKGSVTSWKRFGITILKNDHTCKYLGLAPTKRQAERQKTIQKKYSKI